MDQNNNQQEPSMAKVQSEKDNAIARVNKKVIIVSIIGILVVLAIAGGFMWYRTSQINAVNERIGMADVEMNDSTQFNMYKAIADESGSYDANQRARLNVAIKYYNEGKYQEALNYLDKANPGSDIIKVGAITLKGDCYANLKKYDEALAQYEKALSVANENPQLTPFILVKEANIYRVQKNYDKELEAYTTIRRDYPVFLADIDKYYERAKAAAGK